VGTAILSIAVNPFLFRLADAIESRTPRRPRARPSEKCEPAENRQVPAVSRAVVVGYGPVGRTVTRILAENAIATTVIEMNIDTVRALRESGIEAVYGDATNETVLQGAGLADAHSLLISVADMSGAEETLRIAKRLNPTIQILARASYVRGVPRLRAAGAHDVFSGEAEVAFAFAATMLDRLGATAEQLDRERARVHAELSTGDLTGPTDGGAPR
jgi:CPA2 family monovalent cation:H+ antiporter-2